MEYLTKKQAEKYVKEHDRDMFTDDNGNVHLFLLVPFRIKRGKWVILKDSSITFAESMETVFYLSFMGHSVKGNSQEDCLLKIIACLAGELYGKGK